ncbi:MAG: hypothetical protein AB7F50_07725 [Fimbriimonadaceae bacterium]
MKDPTVVLEKYSSEAEVLTVSDARPGAPWLLLGSSGDFRPTELDTVVLDNGLVRATVCPQLGGRLIALRDLRVGRDVIPHPSRIETSPGGVRGRIWNHGLSLCLDGPDRPNAMGSVTWALREGEGASGHAALFTFEIVLGTGLSVTTCWAVPAGRCEVLLQCKATNRTATPQSYRPLWMLGGEWASHTNPEGVGLCMTGTDLGLQFHGSVTAEQVTQGTALAPGVQEGVMLGPWQTAVHTLRVVPLASLGLPSTVAGSLSARVAGNRVILQSQVPGQVAATVALEDGSLHEALIELGGAPLDTELEGSVVQIRVQGESGNVLEWPDPRPQVAVPVRSALNDAWIAPTEGSAEAMLLAGTLTEPAPGLEAGVLVAKAERSYRSGDFASARSAWGEATGYCPENESVWWALSHVMARLGEDNSEALANAHFLSPLEPLLRAEAFLATPIAEGKDPSPLLVPLVEDPDSLLDVLCRLLDVGDRASAARLAEEAMRHTDIPLVRWLYAWNLMTGSLMDAEAAAQAAQAAAQAPAPPLPWRPMERRAVKETIARFSDLKGAQLWLELLG